MTLVESRFTRSRSDCPHPEWWHSADDESTEMEVSELVAAFVRALQPALVVESGTAFGQTAEVVGRALITNGHGTLETFEIDPARADIASARCADLPVTVRRRPFSELTASTPIDFAWIDGHIAQRVADLRHIRLLLASGAIVGVHDTGPQHPIRESVEAEDWIRWIHLPTPRGVMFGQVR